MKIIVALLVAVVAAVLLVVMFYPEAPTRESVATVQPQKSNFVVEGPIQPVPAVQGLDPEKVALGKQLFSDPVLSKDNSISCASCHSFSLAGSNGLAVAIGVGGAVNRISSPTVFNSSLNFKQFWDGRADTLEEQVSGPLLNPIEMGSTWEGVISRLEANADYVKQFTQAYPAGITSTTVSHAIAEFERSLLTPDSDFDRYLKGDKQALTADEIDGYQQFLILGCVRCHQGVGIGGNMFQKMGAKQDYFGERGGENKHDLGRFNVTGDEFDKYRFKVPSLRNVAVTAPYFHDGNAATLSDAVDVMARYQLGRHLSENEHRLILAFLNSLTGEYQGKKLTLGDTDQAGTEQ